jgi:trimeric autotransporter adhesin
MTRTLACVFLLTSLAGFSGCSSGPASTNGSLTTPAVRATGSVYGGQNPVSGAVIQLWAVGTSGYGSAATPLISATVTTSDGSSTADSNANAGNAFNTLAAGGFTITGMYTCPTASTLVYLSATGGNPGLGGTVNNSAIVMLAALGQCGSLTSSTFI